MKQQQITYDKGITNVPSDMLCSDNALAECVGLTYENGENKPIQRAKEFITSAVDGSTPIGVPHILYRHEFNNKKIYVGFTSSNIIIWGEKDGLVFEKEGTLQDTDDNDVVYDSTTKITSVGKTLILSRDSGMLYFLWNPDENDYECLGSSFPYPDIEYEMKDGYHIYERIEPSGLKLSAGTWSIENQTNWNNCVVGLYSSVRKKIWRKKSFIGSFCVRAALELYDGTYYLIQNPVFMLNHFSAYCMGYLDTFGDEKLTIELVGQRLYYRFHQDYTKWTDIIKNVVLFVTREADLFDTISDAILEDGYNSEHANESIYYYMNYGSIIASTTKVGDHDPNPSYNGVSHIVLESIPDSDLKNVIEDGVYYKLCEIGIKGDFNERPADMHFDTHTIENLTTQPRLVADDTSDDYYNHCDIKAGMMYSYNSRLNLAQVRRGIFDGFDYFMPFRIALDGVQPPSPNPTYKFYVTIQTEDGEKTVVKTLTDYNKQGIYFYYPDARAKHVVIKRNDSYILDEDLTEHPMLNGAYYFAGVSPSVDEPGAITPAPDDPVVSTDKYETLPNYILTSEVNNPFVFRPQGYYKVGTGKIIGCSTVTHALSEGQFGQFPLLVFSESGVWALTVGSTGYYTSIHPISREVCNNADSITQTDGAVYFTSTKGLMVIIGSSVKCVSEQMDGKNYVGTGDLEPLGDCNFKGFLEGCMIAYDYRDSQLLILNKNKTYHYVYNMKSSTFSKMSMNNKYPVGVVNGYPDNLIQEKTVTTSNNVTTETIGSVYSLLEKPDQNFDYSSGTTPNYYTCWLITRPMKMENGLSLKTIMDLKNIYTINAQGSITLYIYGSNNCKNWLEVPSLTGVPWKYYRFKFEFNKLKASDRFAGTVLVTQERRTNQLR